MKYLSIFTLIVLTFNSQQSLAQSEDCECPAIQQPVQQLVNTLRVVSESFYKDIIALKVNMDGEGKFSVHFEKGNPKLIKLTYKNGDGTEIIQKSFAELERGGAMVYENKDRPGKAIVLQAGTPFRNGNKYKLVMSVRTGIDPDKFSTHELEFDSNPNSPKIMNKNKPFKSIIMSPGLSFMNWDGTFKKVEFK